MNLYVTLKGSLSTELRPAYIKFYVVTSNIGNISDPHYWDSGGVNPISPINMSITSTDNSMSFFGNSTQTMSFTANFLNEANNRSSYNFSIDEMNVHFLLPSFLVSNNSIKLSFGATLYGLSKTVSIQSNIVMNDTDLSG